MTIVYPLMGQAGRAEHRSACVKPQMPRKAAPAQCTVGSITGVADWALIPQVQVQEDLSAGKSSRAGVGRNLADNLAE